MTAPLTVPEALIHAMVTTSAADHRMTAAEFAKIRALVGQLPAFESFSGDVMAVAEACVATIETPRGLDAVLDALDASLTPALKETAYALAVDVAAADVHVKQEELVFLQMMEDRFGLDKLIVAAIERSARIRFRKAG
jgi:Tellurite resistance protein TerB.